MLQHNFEHTMLNERSQFQKITYCMTLLTRNAQKGKSIKKVSRLAVTKRQGRKGMPGMESHY